MEGQKTVLSACVTGSLPSQDGKEPEVGYILAEFLGNNDFMISASLVFVIWSCIGFLKLRDLKNVSFNRHTMQYVDRS